jgi:hypothetical protein
VNARLANADSLGNIRIAEAVISSLLHQLQANIHNTLQGVFFRIHTKNLPFSKYAVNFVPLLSKKEGPNTDCD